MCILLFLKLPKSVTVSLVQWTVGGLSRMALFAIKDILPGEEICYDYNFSLFNTDQGQECKCGAKDCRGVIGGKGKDFLITLKDDEAESSSPHSGLQHKVAVATDPTGQVVADEKWFRAHLSEEDARWFEKNAPKFQQLEAKTIKCTVCNECLNFKLLGQIQRHPELGRPEPCLILLGNLLVRRHRYQFFFTEEEKSR